MYNMTTYQWCCHSIVISKLNCFTTSKFLTASFLNLLVLSFSSNRYLRYLKLLTSTVLSTKAISRGASTGVRTIIVHTGGVHWTVVGKALALVII